MPRAEIPLFELEGLTLKHLPTGHKTTLKWAHARCLAEAIQLVLDGPRTGTTCGWTIMRKYNPEEHWVFQGLSHGVPPTKLSRGALVELGTALLRAQKHAPKHEKPDEEGDFLH